MNFELNHTLETHMGVGAMLGGLVGILAVKVEKEILGGIPPGDHYCM